MGDGGHSKESLQKTLQQENLWAGRPTCVQIFNMKNLYIFAHLHRATAAWGHHFVTWTIERHKHWVFCILTHMPKKYIIRKLQKKHIL